MNGRGKGHCCWLLYVKSMADGLLYVDIGHLLARFERNNQQGYSINRRYFHLRPGTYHGMAP